MGAVAAAVAGAGLLVADQAQARGSMARGSMAWGSMAGAVLSDPAGRPAGYASFTGGHHGTVVSVVLFKNRYVLPGTFHGLHIHANADAANGSGCVADPELPPATWFVSADAHYAAPGQPHGAHFGDLPSPLVSSNGRAVISFTTDRLQARSLRGRTVVLHAGPDNAGNVPIGDADDRYTPNSPSAVEKTAKTGNAGDRVACGVIR